MKRTLYSLVMLTIGFSACKKDAVKEPEPATTVTMTRTIHFTATGAEKDTAYTMSDKIITEAGFSNFSSGTEKNTFYIFFNAGPHVDNAAGDFIHFQVDKEKLKEGYVGTYLLNSASSPLQHIRYLYIIRDAKGGIYKNISESDMGLNMYSELTIEKYDAVRKTISGSYRMTASLNGDPTKPFSYYDPNAKCQLDISGVFDNVKIKQD